MGIFVYPYSGLVHFFVSAGYLTRCHSLGSPRVTLWMAARESTLLFEVAMEGRHLLWNLLEDIMQEHRGEKVGDSSRGGGAFGDVLAGDILGGISFS